MGKAIKHNFEKLEIGKLAIDLADEFYYLIQNLPREEQFGLYSQISPASVSISSNIAEGSSGSNTYFSRYLVISLGSSYELQTQLILCKRRNYINEEEFGTLLSRLKVFRRKTISFQKQL